MKTKSLLLNDFKFFQDYHDAFKKVLSENDKKSFMDCPNDEAKFIFVRDKISKAKQNWNFVFEPAKDNSTAQSFKEKGNKCFQEEKYPESLEMYNKSLLYIEFSDGPSRDASILFANRSAVLNHLEKYEAALEDIKEALELGYPKDIAYKVKERKAKCLLALKQHKSALDAFKEALTSLDDAKIPTDKKKKMQLDIQIMISMLAQYKTLTNERLNQKPLDTKLETLSRTVSALSNKVIIDKNETEGRFAKATEDITVGESILVEDSYACILLEAFAKTHCYHCLRSVPLTPYPCRNCPRVIFCSRKCERIAQSSHHRIECFLIPFIWKSGLSGICYISLRILAQNGEHFFEKIQEFIEEKGVAPTKKHSALEEKCLKVYNLVTHCDLRPVDDYLHIAHVAQFLFQLLKTADFFKTKNTKLENFIGGLLIHHIQALQFNCHEVADMVGNDENAKSRFIGVAIYPTLSLFNHSCEPNVVRYFRGSKVYVNACKNFKRGDQICENYGPLYIETSKEERQQTLSSQYWFNCHCVPCENDWPLFDKMEMSQELRFRCETENCNNVVTVATDTMDFMIKCGSCDQFINIFKGLKNLQDTESLFRLANNHKQNQEYDIALKKFIELMILLDGNLVPPYKDYALCQRAIQICFLNLSHIKRNGK